MLAGFIFQYVERVEYTPNFKPVTSWRRIGSRYLRGWAAIEVLSLGVPFDPRVSRALALEIISLLKLLRMLRLFRVRARREKRLTAIGRAEVIWHTKIISISHLLIVLTLGPCCWLRLLVGVLVRKSLPNSWRKQGASRASKRRQRCECCSEGVSRGGLA